MGKNIRAKVSARDLSASSAFDKRPPIGIEQKFLTDPVRDGLLRDSGVPSLSHPGGESSLASPGDLNGALERGNVRFLHDHAKYTNRFVSATTPFVSEGHKEVCKVLDMAQSRAALRRPAKHPKAPKKERRALPGPDGKTLGQRVSEAMAYKSGRIGREYRQVDLLEEVNQMAGTPPSEPFLSQQMLSAILANRVTRTSKAPFIAMACGVNPGWLIQGVGKMTASSG